MKGYQNYYKRNDKRSKYIFFSVLIIIVGYFLIKNIPHLPFFNFKKKKFTSIELMLEKYDSENDPIKKNNMLGKVNKAVEKLLENPAFQEDGYLAYLTGSYNFRKGQLENNNELINMYLDKAVYYFRKAMALLPKMKVSGRLHYELGKCYFFKGDYYYYESLLELKKAKILGFTSPNIDKLIAIIKFKKGDLSDEKYLMEQFSGNKDEIENYFTDALTFKNNKEYNKAKDYFLKIEDFFSKKRVENEEKKYILYKTLYTLGWLYYNDKNYDGSEDYYLKALMYDEKNADIYYWLAKVYIAKKNSKKAKKMLEKAIEIDPQYKSAKLKLKNLR